MFKKSKNGWSKHIDFILLDLAILELSFLFAYYFREGSVHLLDNSLYRNMALIIALLIIFSQIRVGYNGKKFKIYKFRSMYPDAEERKEELINENCMDDRHMFKMEFDPRVIGNKILPNGKRKTGIGSFIRKTSIDEFPQFFNVLKGNMSLVGTRPPTVEEVETYDLHHKSRLSTKPGITGLWQISGRSQITDFEKVVELDTDYIKNWSLALDAKILLKTVRVVLCGRGSM